MEYLCIKNYVSRLLVKCDAKMFFAFVMAIGMTPLVGTMNEKYMKEDIELLDRIRSGDKIFKDADELRVIGDALGTPGWEVVDVEEL